MNRMFRRTMYVVVLALGVAVTGGCVTTSRQPPQVGTRSDSLAVFSSPAPASVDGDEVARALQRRYSDRTAACSVAGNAHLPAALCSGILFRATTRGTGYHVWNPNPSSRLREGVSFSWLRQDSAFNGTVYDYTNGFVVMPYVDAASQGLTRLNLLCVYVFDADTFNRTGGANDGCAAHTAFTGTGPCQAQGIFDAAQWLARFRNATNRYAEQCAFIVRPGTPDADRAFMAAAVARTGTGASAMSLHDEVMVGTWTQDDRSLPIEAFFFKAGTWGMGEARANQIDFQAATGRRVPIIEITLPTTLNGAATFRYMP